MRGEHFETKLGDDYAHLYDIPVIDIKSVPLVLNRTGPIRILHLKNEFNFDY